MKELQSVALGLIVVFLDLPPDGPDWVADPIGWLLVLVGIAGVRERLTDYGYLQVTAWVCLSLSVVTWPPDSVPHLDDTLGWVFDLPTLAFCFLLADSLTDVTRTGLARRFRAISWMYALAAVLPLLVLLAGWESLETPAEVLTIIVSVALVLSLFSASDEDAVLDESQGTAARVRTDEPAARSTPQQQTAPDATQGTKQNQGMTAEKATGSDTDRGGDAGPPEGKHKA